MFARRFKRFVSDQGMLLVLLLLCAYFSWRTWTEQQPAGETAARQLLAKIASAGADHTVLVVAGDAESDREFAMAFSKAAGAWTTIGTVTGSPADARAKLEELNQARTRVDFIAASGNAATWTVLDDLPARFPALGNPTRLSPTTYHWPNFLKRDNLLNIANQIAVIAIIAIGMTLVIITGGIDLSVGSLIALSAVTTAWLIQHVAGATEAGVGAMLLCALAGMGVCGVAGVFNGCMVAFFRIPPFIATLAMMLVASGVAFIIARGESIYQLPASFVWLGRGADLFNLPNAVVLMALLYAGAHLLMNRTVPGRYIYAVGSNQQTARLCGLPIAKILVLVYAISGALAGLGGVITASQLKSGAPTYGQMYELYVIAAAVVGGTSLQGGEGRILGTLTGAFIIAVIQNGMNLTGVESYTQKVVLGVVILLAVLLDQSKKGGGWSRLVPFTRQPEG